MNNGKIGKIEGLVITEEDIEKINQFTNRKFEAGELFNFKVRLCDNDIDRDFERFDREALDALQVLFVGRTGISDHNPRAANQQARIYETQVRELTGEQTLDGQPCIILEAKAYMVRTDSNTAAILEIEAGIKKEVSVGCKMEREICSICGQDRRVNPCGHMPGKNYDGTICHVVLSGAADAYEWSFVAVPAQRNAGVTKEFCPKERERKQMETVLKAMATGEGLSLTAMQARELCLEIERLRQDSEAARREVRKRVLLIAGQADSETEKNFAAALDGMSITEMKAVGRLLERDENGEKSKGLDSPQLTQRVAKENPKDKSFLI